MLAIQPVRSHVSDEKLAAVCVGARIRHRKGTDLVLVRVVFRFVLKAMAGTTSPRALRISALNHEVGDDPVEHCSVVKTFTGKEHEVIDRLRRVLGEKVNDDCSSRRFE